MSIRRALPEDLDAIFSIYDREVLEGTATFDTVPYTPEQRRAWLAQHQSDRHPALVLEEAGEVVAWGTLSPWSDRCAYARAAEISVYVHEDARRKGHGRAMVRTLVDWARREGLGALLARITSESTASLALHESLGFARVGSLKRVGEKFGRVLDVEVLELLLDGHAL